MSDADSPFVPGARVAMKSGWNYDIVTECRVDKVYKNGNFTLRNDSSRQQYKPRQISWSGRIEWTADATGDHRFSRIGLTFWDAAANAEIEAAIATTKRRARYRAIKARLDSIREEHLTDDMLDKMELALPRKP